MDLGNALKIYREKNNFSQETVASFLGIKREVLSYFENNSREPSLVILEKLADLYGAELLDFFEKDENSFKTNYAFAFRAENIEERDLLVLSKFRKVVKNYVRISALAKDYA